MGINWIKVLPSVRTILAKNHTFTENRILKNHNLIYGT